MMVETLMVICRKKFEYQQKLPYMNILPFTAYEVFNERNNFAIQGSSNFPQIKKKVDWDLVEGNASHILGEK